MVTFTITQINDALDHIKRFIANHIRKRMTINLTDDGDCRKYTIADLREAGWDDFDLVRLLWADPRTPWAARIAFKDEKKRIDRLKEFRTLVTNPDQYKLKFLRRIEFFKHLLDAYNSKGTTEAAE